jgi:hypothetical protein
MLLVQGHRIKYLVSTFSSYVKDKKVRNKVPHIIGCVLPMEENESICLHQNLHFTGLCYRMTIPTGSCLSCPLFSLRATVKPVLLLRHFAHFPFVSTF